MQTASSLMRKHRIASEYLPPVAEALRTLEEAIVGRYGSKKLAALQKKEAAFKERVLDHEQHRGLDNPYDLPTPSGTLARSILLVYVSPLSFSENEEGAGQGG